MVLTLESSIENDYTKFISIYRQLLANEENKGRTLKNIQELMTFTDRILSSSAVSEAFFYFCLHGAATSWILQNELQMAEATTYRALKRLRSMKVVIPALRVSARGRSEIRGGPRPTVWALQEATDNEVAAALRLHYKLLSPKYCVAETIAQTILEEYKSKALDEISYDELIIRVKAMKTPFITRDVVGLAADYLIEKGIKVYR